MLRAPLRRLPEPTNPPPKVIAYPRVISQALDERGMVRVLFSLPGLRRAEVSVPYESWLRGEHLQISHDAHELLCNIVGPPFV